MILFQIVQILNNFYNYIDKIIKKYLYKKHLVKLFKESENKYKNFVANRENYEMVHFLDNFSNNIINKDKKILKKFDNIYYYEFLSRCRYRHDTCVKNGDILLKDNKIFLVLENTNIKDTGFCRPECYCGYCIPLDEQKNKKFIEEFNRQKKYYRFNNEV